MYKKNVVLLGGSNSVMVNGLQKGLREGIEKYNENAPWGGGDLEFYNFALGATLSLQNLYELKRDRNQSVLKEAELIISESNVNDAWCYDNNKIYEIVETFFLELSHFKAKILILILPYFKHKIKTINAIHKKLALKFNFNIIDLDEYYKKYNLIEFFNLNDDGEHQFNFIMHEFGKSIMQNIDNFIYVKREKLEHSFSDFKICKIEELENITSKNTIYNQANSMFNEECVRVFDGDVLKIPDKYKGFKLIAFHSWTTTQDCDIEAPNDWLARRNIICKIHIYNEKSSISFTPCLDNIIYGMDFYNTDLIVLENTFLKIEKDNNSRLELSHCDLIAFFLALPNENYQNKAIDFEALANENIQISKEYDFNHLIPPVELYKEIIDEYCARMDPIKLAPLQKQITDLTNERNSLHNEKTQLQNELNSIPTKKANLEVLNLEQDLINKKLQSKKLAKEIGVKLDVLMPKITLISANSAKARIHSHLSYKLGSALIANSKSILGYIRMPFVLSYIKDKHKKEQKAYEVKIKENPNLALPPLESYADYNEALKEKECFTYKLGKAFIKAHKNWYGGGISNFTSKMCLG